MQEDLETVLVRTCRLLRTTLGPYPDLITCWVGALEQYPDDVVHMCLAAEKIAHYSDKITAALERTRKMRPSSSLDAVALRSLRHDIDSPLTALIGFSELLLENRKDTSLMRDAAQLYLPLLRNSAAQMTMWLHIDTEEEIEVNKLFGQVSGYIQPELALRDSTLTIGSAPQKVRVIPSFTVRRLHQTLRNALKARVYTSRPYDIQMDASTQGAYCVVAITDCGIGIYPSVIQDAARSAGYRGEQPTPYDTLCMIFKPGVSGFKQMNRVGHGYGFNTTALVAQGGQHDVDVETTILHYSGKLLTINREHPHGYFDPAKTTTGTTFTYYLPLAKAPSKT